MGSTAHAGSPVRQDQNIGLRMICKAPSIAKLIGMINTDHVAIAHVPGSLHLGRVQLEVSLCRPRERASRGLKERHGYCGTRRELCVERLCMYCAALERGSIQRPWVTG